MLFRIKGKGQIDTKMSVRARRKGQNDTKQS